MKRPVAIWINITFRLIVSFAYFLFGLYVAFYSEFDLGITLGVPTIVLFGVLFMGYGLFRRWFHVLQNTIFWRWLLLEDNW